MYIDEIKKELSRKILDMANITARIDAHRDALIKAMKANKHWTKDLSEEELEEASSPYAADKKKKKEIIKDLMLLTIETKYNLMPLLGKLEKRVLRLLFNRSEKQELYLFSNRLEKKGLRLLSNRSDLIEEAIERYLEQSFTTQRENMKKRLNKLKVAYLDVVIEPRIRELYREIVSCYVGGNFNATCVLCRAAAELIAKDHISTGGYGYLLSGNVPKIKKANISNILKNKLSMPEKIVGLYNRLASKGNLVLHERDEKTEEKEALNSIKRLQAFIMKLPKRL